jgi:DNA modification methylase
MPTLQFKGKAAIWNHHLSVPYHTLEEDRKLHYQPEKGDGNLIIEGDNLLALKALLPQYAGKIKCIYIDPPYNTGNEHWVYNDNVNSPLIKEWIGKEVGKDDLTRHDKWLCMMVPRLKLLRELLADDGVIFISIDDNEMAYLRSLMDEFFGQESFIATVIWQKVYAPKSSAKFFSEDHEYITVFAKDTEKWTAGLLERTKEQDKAYKNPDNDPRGLWRPNNLAARNRYSKGVYPIITPGGRRIEGPPKGSYWRISEEKLRELDADNRIWWGENGTNVPAPKIFLSEVKQGRTPQTLWFYKDVGHTQDAKKELIELMDFEFSEDVFLTPKPVSLVKRILQIATSPDSIILDSFAGSGTTMHAVMELNKEDGGDRKCILVQMTEADEKEPKKNICKDITRERVKRAIDKNSYDSGFRYLRVGQPIDAETMLAGNLPSYKDFAKYVYYLCTGQHLPDEKSIVEKEFFVGLTGKTGIYLIYKKDPDALSSMALNLSQAEAMRSRHPEGRLVVYAPACFLDEEYMREHGIEFVSIPYGMFTKTGERA